MFRTVPANIYNYDTQSLGYTRLQFLCQLMEKVRSNTPAPKTDWQLLFTYYSVGSYFTRDSVNALVFDFYTSKNYIPIITDSTANTIFTVLLKSERSLTLQEFLDRFFVNPKLLIQIYDSLHITNTSINANNRFIILQIIFTDNPQMNKYEPDQLFDIIKGKLKELAMTDENSVTQIIGVRNLRMVTFDYVVEMVKPVNVYTFPPVFGLVIDQTAGRTHDVHCLLYANQTLPLNCYLFDKESILTAGVKNVGSKISDTASDLNEKYAIMETLGKGKEYLTEQINKFRNSDTVKNTTEGVSKVVEDVKKRVTGED